MTAVTVYKQGWSLDDIPWSLFDPEKVAPGILAAVKAAALVEYNAPDYVIYLKRVFAGAGQQTLDAIEQWGREEAQHGKSLGRWAEMADPGFKLDQAFVRFRAGYSAPHLAGGDRKSVRGSCRGEMIARCVVESGTSSYYSAIRDATEEPVLKEIAGRIAADEYRHYKLFYGLLHVQPEPELSFWARLRIAIGRVRESDDDELAYAYYCANVPADQQGARRYDRRTYSRASAATSMAIYRRKHIQKLVQMVAKAVGVNPHGWIARLMGAILWRRMQGRAGTA
jgi:hypothetical protein